MSQACFFQSPGGGFGNLLFQVCALYSHAKKNNHVPIFNSIYEDKKRPNIQEYKELFRMIGIVAIDQTHLSSHVYYAPRFHETSPTSYTPIHPQTLLLHGYMQSYQYFWDHKFELFDMMKNNDSTRFQKAQSFIQSQQPMSNKDGEVAFMHLRRTDYLPLPRFHPVCSDNYYEQAMKQLPERCSLLLVFSDDIEYAKQLPCCQPDMSNKKIVFVEEEDVVTTFFMMCLCQHSIIANSSLSLLGMLFQPTTSEPYVRIVPSVWFGPDGPSFDHKQVMPIDDLNIKILPSN